MSMSSVLAKTKNGRRKKKEDGKLFFPTTGFRDKNGKLHNKENETNLWARREDYADPSRASVFRIRKNADNQIGTRISTEPKNMGYSVRCIKDYPLIR